MDNNNEKIRLIIIRAVLIVIGGCMGYLALWQYFLFYPNVVGREYQIVITVVSAALVALLFGLSAKAVYKLVMSIVGATKGLKDNVGVRGIIAVVLGLVAAGAVVVAFDVMICRVVDIWAVRLLADVLAYIAGASGCCVGFTKWLNAPRTENADKTEKTDAPAVGYLLSAECFTDERVITAVYTLINAKVCDGAYKALCLYGGDGGAEGAKLMDALIKKGNISVIKTGKEFDCEDAYRAVEKQLAVSKRLKRVAPENDERAVLLSSFSQPTDEMKQAVAALRAKDAEERERTENTLVCDAPAEVVNGQIIIDK